MKHLLAACLALAALFSCKDKSSEKHAHNPDGSHPGEELQALSYTLYSDSTELFVEFKPLVAGSTSGFATHLTHLGENFSPYTEGTVTVSLLVGDKGLKNTAAAPASPGIFRLALQPNTPGWGRLVFDIEAKGFRDQIIIDSIRIYPDEKTALADQKEEGGGTDISYLKEQAWKVEFANTPIKRETIYNIIKASGQILPAPGDEVTVAAKSNGLIKFSSSGSIIGAPVRAGQALFTVSGGDIAGDNIDAAIQAARAELNTAKTEFDRASALIADKLITQADYQQAKLRYQTSQIALNNLSKGYSRGGKTITAPMSGFVKSILVSEGQFVTAGQPLATLTKNQRLVLRADVSLKDADQVPFIQEANFILPQHAITYNTRALNARLLATGKSTGDNSPFIPVHFQLDIRPGIIPGTFAEVYLLTTPIHNALVVPASALIEEQGVFYVYVQTAGESFQKREVRLGANDGIRVQLLSGVSEGERVVTKGAYQIKLSTASGTMPAHGHEH
ncbi:MAG TPA: efflux RND transporter periplasmic adaptor subunit [Flavisolibacter sp.]|jgi:RND family efflux transporter MFP subunit